MGGVGGIAGDSKGRELCLFLLEAASRPFFAMLARWVHLGDICVEGGGGGGMGGGAVDRGGAVSLRNAPLHVGPNNNNNSGATNTSGDGDGVGMGYAGTSSGMDTSDGDPYREFMVRRYVARLSYLLHISYILFYYSVQIILFYYSVLLFCSIYSVLINGGACCV